MIYVFVYMYVYMYMFECVRESMKLGIRDIIS